MSSNWTLKMREAMEVQGMPGVFVLGSFERRVTFYSQQVRALNLAAALISSKRCGSGSHVGVVGAGLSGLTFAAAMARHGVKVTVLEKENDPLSLLRHKPPRWLHPHVYDWPQKGWDNKHANLPVLDWEAGNVPEVAKQLKEKWKNIRMQHKALIHESYRAQGVQLKSQGNKVSVSWNNISKTGRPTPQTDSFTLVVLSVGFGLEEEKVPEYRSYWEPDNLNEDASFILGKTPPRTWLVSGVGDGALTDLLRLCISKFSLEDMVNKFFSNHRLKEVAKQIWAIERDPRSNNSEFLHKAYEELNVDFFVKWIGDRLRKDTKVILNAETQFYFQRYSSRLNRFLVSQLRRAGGFSFICGKLDAVQENGRRLLVNFENMNPEEVDRVVVRHGPKPALEKDFPDVWKACENMRANWKQIPTLLDQTRKRYWKKEMFSHEDLDSHTQQFQADDRATREPVSQVRGPTISPRDENRARSKPEDRRWVEDLDHTAVQVFSDWDPFCQNVHGGVSVDIKYVECEPDLPEELKTARDRLRTHVMDEGTLDQPNAPFNGPQYCLRSFKRDVRRFGKTMCTLEFGPSDYRTFLVTNGINQQWAELAGLSATFGSPWQWGTKWGATLDSCSFFRNSFGINILISTLGDNGQRYVLFNRRNSRTAVRPGTTGASANEGLRRAYNDTILFDQRSPSDPTPDLEAAAFRAVAEELGLSKNHLGGTRPILLSVGQVRSLFQPAALFYWPLNMPVSQLNSSLTKAPDRNLEFDSAHFVRFTRKDIINFVRQSEAVAPIESWVVVLALYALDIET